MLVPHMASRTIPAPRREARISHSFQSFSQASVSFAACCTAASTPPGHLCPPARRRRRAGCSRGGGAQAEALGQGAAVSCHGGGCGGPVQRQQGRRQEHSARGAGPGQLRPALRARRRARHPAQQLPAGGRRWKALHRNGESCAVQYYCCHDACRASSRRRPQAACSRGSDQHLMHCGRAMDRKFMSVH